MATAVNIVATGAILLYVGLLICAVYWWRV
jgi:hypothetical protein